MKVAKVTIALVAAIVCSADVNAALSVVQRGSGFRIDRNGKPLVNAVIIENGKKGEVGKDEVKTSFCKSARFGKVWNRWLEKSDGRYRLEVAELPGWERHGPAVWERVRQTTFEHVEGFTYTNTRFDAL